MKRTIFLTISLIAAIATSARGEEPVEFADANLKAAVEKALKVSNPTPSKMLELTALAAVSKEIGDLSGLEHATNLTNLSLDNNKISDISALSNLTALTKLWLSGNQITDISALSGMTKLDRLFLFKNEISDITVVANFENLTGLSLYRNKISDISPVAGLKNLQFLWFGGNEISDVSPIAGLTGLPQLSLYKNQISDVSALEGLDKLTYLELHDNQVKDVSALAAMTELTFLWISGNEISDVSPIAGMVKLTDLRLYDNKISDMSPAAGLPKLNKLSLKGNPVKTLGKPLSEFKNFKLELGSAEYTNLSGADESDLVKVKMPKDVSELALVRDNCTIVIRTGDGEVVLPEGEYPVSHWKIMRKDDKDDKWELQGSGFSKKALLKVSSDSAANLQVGEPIKAVLTVTRRSSSYSLSQKMTGRLGEKVSILKNGSRPEAPQVRIVNADSSYDKTFKFKYG